MRFEYTDGNNKDFIELCHGLDDFLNELVGGEENRAEYIPYNQLDDIHDVIIAYDDDIPVGSASFKKYDDECAEVKRVFIKQEYRGKGISNTLMELLENAARKQGYGGIGGRTGFVQFLRGRKAVLLIGGNGSCHLL